MNPTIADVGECSDRGDARPAALQDVAAREDVEEGGADSSDSDSDSDYIQSEEEGDTDDTDSDDGESETTLRSRPSVGLGGPTSLSQEGPANDNSTDGTSEESSPSGASSQTKPTEQPAVMPAQVPPSNVAAGTAAPTSPSPSATTPATASPSTSTSGGELKRKQPAESNEDTPVVPVSFEADGTTTSSSSSTTTPATVAPTPPVGKRKRSASDEAASKRRCLGRPSPCTLVALAAVASAGVAVACHHEPLAEGMTATCAMLRNQAGALMESAAAAGCVVQAQAVPLMTAVYGELSTHLSAAAAASSATSRTLAAGIKVAMADGAAELCKICL